MAEGDPQSIAAALLARLPSSPDAYPQKLDLIREALLLVEMDRGAYDAASFLDDRILGPATRGAWVPVARVAEASRATTNARALHFILHTGHVGSTLVSRLLDATGEVLSLREPLPLRTLAEAHDGLGRADSLLGEAAFGDLVALFLGLWRRGYEGTRSVVVKATSSASRMAGPILAASPASRAIYLNLRPEPYLATILAGRNSPLDLRGHGPERIRRLQLRVAAALAPLHSLSLGELAALSWLAETFTQHDLLRGFADRVVAIDFDSFLADVAGWMRAIVGHFGMTPNASYLAEVARSPVLTRYSKAPEYAYTPEVRAEVLRDARRDHREQIGKGLAWLDRLARADAGVAAVLKSGSDPNYPSRTGVSANGADN